MQAFVGLLQYIARYIHRLSEFTHWLALLAHKDNKRWTWCPDQEKAWQAIRERVRNIKWLHHPTDDGEFLVQTDASQYAIGGVLYQFQYVPKIKKKLLENY